MTFVQRHFYERLGEHAGHRSSALAPEEVSFIQRKAFDGVPTQHIAQMTGRCRVDVQRVVDEMTLLPQAWPRLIPSGVETAIPVSAPTSPGVVVGFQISISAQLGHELARPLPTMRSICLEVCREYGVTLEQLRGPQKAQRFTRPRQAAMWRLATDGRWSLPQIGQYLGHRDHTTVLYGRRRHAARLAAVGLLEAA